MAALFIMELMQAMFKQMQDSTITTTHNNNDFNYKIDTMRTEMYVHKSFHKKPKSVPS